MSRKSRTKKKAAEPTRPQFSRKKKLIFSAITLIGFFVVTEGLLTLLGVKTLAAARDPYVGFESRLHLFEQHRDPNGRFVYRTAENKLGLFNPQTFPVRKDADAFRIFCMGGSTTHGRPYRDDTSFVGWLREFLKAADPSRDWQVVNCGGVSYASYRVAALMEELVQYDPDLFIVLTGHNEFLEQRTYHGIIEQHPVVSELQMLLYRSRIAALSERVIRRVLRDPHEEAMDRYRLTGEVRPILDRSAGLDLYHRDEPLRQQILAHFRFNLGRMASLATTSGADIMFVQPAVNLKDFSPFKSQHRDGLSAQELETWDALVDRGVDALSAADYTTAREAFENALKIDDRFANLHYDLGRTLFALGEFDRAKEAFVRALEEDVCPLRMLPRMNDIVAEVAAQQGADVIDFRSRLIERCRREQGHSIPGKEYFLDHVHPTIAMHRVIGRQILDHLIERGLVRPVADWGDARADQVAARIEGAVDEYDHAIARGVLAKVLRWAGKTEESDQLIAGAEDVLANDAEGCALLAQKWVREGKLDRAIEGYHKALMLNPDLPESYLGLALAYRRQGHTDEALDTYARAISRDPAFATAHFEMAQTLRHNGRPDEALRHLEAVERIDADYPGLHLARGMVFAARQEATPALTELHEALRKDPRSGEAAAQIALVLRSQGKPREAVEYFEKAMAIGPASAGLHNELALTLMGTGDTEGALSHFRTAIEIDPKFGQAHFYLGVYYAQVRDFTRAVDEFEQAVTLEPNSPPSHFNLGLAYMRLGDLQQAVRVFRHAVTTWPDQSEMALKLAWLLATAPDPELRDGNEALQLAQRACESEAADRTACLYTLAAAHAETGRFDLAIEKAGQAILEAASRNMTSVVRRVREQLAYYQQNRPFRLTSRDVARGG